MVNAQSSAARLNTSLCYLHSAFAFRIDRSAKSKDFGSDVITSFETSHLKLRVRSIARLCLWASECYTVLHEQMYLIEYKS
eukprot:6208531-Pleurochrysis_carterae.AAC.7